MQVPQGVHHETVCKRARSDRRDMMHKHASACLFANRVAIPAGRRTRLLVSADAAALYLTFPSARQILARHVGETQFVYTHGNVPAIVRRCPACRINNIPCKTTGAACGLQRRHGRIIEVAAWVQDSMSRTSLTHLHIARSRCVAIMQCAPSLPSVRLA